MTPESRSRPFAAPYSRWSARSRSKASGMLSHAAAAILRLRSGSAARVLHLHIWRRVAREGLEPGRAAEAEAVGLERPPGCGRGGVAASSTPPGRAGQSLLRELIAPAFAIRAGPSVGSGTLLCRRGFCRSWRETVLWSQQRRQGQVRERLLRGCRGPSGRRGQPRTEDTGTEAQAAAGLRAAAAPKSDPQPAEEILRQWKADPAGRVASSRSAPAAQLTPV